MKDGNELNFIEPPQKAKTEPIETLFCLSEAPLIEGQTLHLKCNFSRPAKGARWYKDGKIILHQPKITTSVEEKTVSLQIQDIDKNDAGRYGVGLGMIKSYLNVDVCEKQLLEISPAPKDMKTDALISDLKTPSKTSDNKEETAVTSETVGDDSSGVEHDAKITTKKTAYTMDSILECFHVPTRLLFV